MLQFRWSWTNASELNRIGLTFARNLFDREQETEQMWRNFIVICNNIQTSTYTNKIHSFHLVSEGPPSETNKSCDERNFNECQSWDLILVSSN